MSGADKPIRVALVSSDVSLQSGAARCLLELARGLRQRADVEPVLYLSRDGPLAEQARESAISVRITAAERPTLRKGILGLAGYVLRFPWDCLRLAYWLRRDRIDLVHANEFIEFQAGVGGRLVGLPRLYHVRWPLNMSAIYIVMAKLTARLASELVAVSKATAEASCLACGRRPEVIYDPGPDTTRFAPSQEVGSVLREFSLPRETQLVTLVSKLHPDKGHETFLEAALAVAERAPKARFMIVGGELPGQEEYARRLYELAEVEPLKGRVVFTGTRSDVPRLLGASAIAVHLSTFPDPFPGVVLEAMSCACAVVASAVGGITEQITDRVDGVLVPPGDAAAVAAALLELLADPARLKRMGEAARARVVARYGLSRHVSALVEIYKRKMLHDG